MDFEDKKKLVEALLKCPSIKDRHTRDTIVNDLPDDISSGITRHSRNRTDVANIVDRCANHVGGLETLIDIVRYHEGDSSIPRQELDRVWTELQLLKLAAGVEISKKELRRLYTASLPQLHSPQKGAVTMRAIVVHLADIPPPHRRTATRC